MKTTPVFDTYWRFASERQKVYDARLAGKPAPWSTDPIISRFKFTNCFRAADRVSQFLIREVAYKGDQSPNEVIFRILLFKLFNRISTWNLLSTSLGRPTVGRFVVEEFDGILSTAFDGGERLYSAAYVIPPPRLGAKRKHTNHLRLLDLMLQTGLTNRLLEAQSLEEAFLQIAGYPAIGNFLAYQFVIDLNYSSALNFEEMDFVVAGPGARDGIRKCFGLGAQGIEREVIEYMVQTQEYHFERLGLNFGGLFGRRLQPIDCQNLFCEVDKYSRVAHPEIAGISGRNRIKQRFTPSRERTSAWFPPKWNINT